MKNAETDYFILCEIDALVSALIDAVRKNAKNLEEQDIFVFLRSVAKYLRKRFSARFQTVPPRNGKRPDKGVF